MIRRALTAAVVVVLWPSALSAAGGWQQASSMWLHRDGPRATLYLALGARRATEAGIETIAGVGVLSCKVVRGRTYTNAICRGRMVVEDIPPGAFRVHPTLDHARLSVPSSAATSVRWSAVEARPNVGFPIVVGPKRTVLRALMWREAEAAGRVAGTRVRPDRRWHRAEIRQAAGLSFGIPARAGSHPVALELVL